LHLSIFNIYFNFIINASKIAPVKKSFSGAAIDRLWLSRRPCKIHFKPAPIADLSFAGDCGQRFRPIS
jgi:hypothetical protein